MNDSTSASDAPKEPGFHNPQRRFDALPDYRELEFEPIARSFRGYTVLTTAIWWLPIAAASAAANFIPGVTLLPGLIAPVALGLLALLIGVYRWVDAGRRGWALRDHDIAAREGIFWRKVTMLPFARIQHVETSSGPIERWKGLARLKLFTAGGMTSDLDIIGLEATTADTLREHLAEQIRLRDALADTAGDSEADSGNDSGDEGG
ncbi:PH domain-containing protein [Halomonas denitrificans]|nr:PH domain-containing protein [Halomonas denitrificans]